MTARAFRMKLKPGTVDAVPAPPRRHVAGAGRSLLSEAGIYDYSIFLDEETLRPVRGHEAARGERSHGAAGASGDAQAGGITWRS